MLSFYFSNILLLEVQVALQLSFLALRAACSQGAYGPHQWPSATINMSELVYLLIWLIYNNYIIKSTKQCELIPVLQICDGAGQGSSSRTKQNSMVVEYIKVTYRSFFAALLNSSIFVYTHSAFTIDESPASFGYHRTTLQLK